MTLKLHMCTAYDRVEWVFVQDMVIALGLHGSFVGLIMRCMTTMPHQVLIDGIPSRVITL